MIRLFRISIPARSFTLCIVEVFTTLACFVAALYLVSPLETTDYLLYDSGSLRILVVSGVLMVGLYQVGLYSDPTLKSKVVLLMQLAQVAGLTLVAEGLVNSFSTALRMPGRAMLAGSFLWISALFGWRLLFSRYAGRILANTRILLVGSDIVLAAVARHIATHADLGLRVVGYVADEEATEAGLREVKHLGPTGRLQEIVQEVQPSRIVVGAQQTKSGYLPRMLEELRYAGEHLQDATEAYQNVCGRLWLRSIDPSELVYTSRFGPPPQAALQRAIDASMAAAAVVLLSPVLGLVWLALRAGASGPAVEKLWRIGLDGKPFKLYRFRLTGAAGSERGGARLARRFGLAGLPQLLNVLKGDMAFVGPDPARPEYAARLSELIPYYPQRHYVRPGMTGWAQIHRGKAPGDTLTELAHDLYYVKNLSLTLNTVILAQAVRSLG